MTKTNIIEMFKFVKDDKEMNFAEFKKWLRENEFLRIKRNYNKFNDGDIWHHKIYENSEWQIDLKYLEKKGGIIKFLSANIKRKNKNEKCKK